MTLQEWLHSTISSFSSAGIDSARLDSLVLASDVLAKDKAWILAHADDYILDSTALSQLRDMTNQRLSGQPIAYITKIKEFYGRDFRVTPDVLVPRPESEVFIDIIKRLEPTAARVLDMGTGSGVLAITAKKEITDLVVTAADESVAALDVAKINAQNLGAKINFVHSDLFENISGCFDIILANLPYVPTSLNVSAEVLAEPRSAVFSGDDGLDLIRLFMSQVAQHLNEGAIVLVESLLSQHAAVADIANQSALKLKQTQGLIQLFEAA